MGREKYFNGDDLFLRSHLCDGCAPSVVNGVLVHESGCPHSWKDRPAECAECGVDFWRESPAETVCKDCAAAADPDCIPPGVEVFYRTVSENRRDGWADSDGETLGRGWYWWSCFPGCLPDSEPFGPFESERAAIADSKGL